MIREDQTNQVRDLVAATQTVLVVLAANATVDQVASASALVLSLQALGKQVMFVSPQARTDGDSFFGLDQLQTQLGNQDLTVSFPYQLEKVDKVSYHIDEASQKFYLVIKPRKGQAPLDPTAVEYSYTGANADLIFLIGVHNFEALEQLYFGYESLYTSLPVVSIHTFETPIGSIKIDVSGTSSQSEAMGNFLFSIGAPPGAEAASNLLLAIEEVTDNFRSLVTSAETFEMVAYLLRQGARRQKRSVGSGFKSKSPLELKPRSSELASAMKPKSIPRESEQVGQQSTSKKTKSKAGDLRYQPSGVSPAGGG